MRGEPFVDVAVNGKRQGLGQVDLNRASLIGKGLSDNRRSAGLTAG